MCPPASGGKKVVLRSNHNTWLRHGYSSFGSTFAACLSREGPEEGEGLTLCTQLLPRETAHVLPSSFAPSRLCSLRGARYIDSVTRAHAPMLNKLTFESVFPVEQVRFEGASQGLSVRNRRDGTARHLSASFRGTVYDIIMSGPLAGSSDARLRDKRCPHSRNVASSPEICRQKSSWEAS